VVVGGWGEAVSLLPYGHGQDKLILFSLTITEDPKIPNAATIVMRKQDHTLGNMIRAYVSFSPRSTCILVRLALTFP
jgi:hypothetical protein